MKTIQFYDKITLVLHNYREYGKTVLTCKKYIVMATKQLEVCIVSVTNN